MQYRAFFSYARADDKIANWLHKQLDGYRAPRSLAGTEGELGFVPATLHPIFRDRTDLEAGGHVDASLQAALEASQTLIVLCTPTSAKSRWVNREVEVFLELGREAAIFPVIAGGIPDSGDPATECFPPALRGKSLLAADLREIKLPTGQLVGDGREMGRLKLIAGLLGVALDRLVQRERRRQRQTVAVLSFSALAFLVLAIAAGAFWWVSDQRASTISSQAKEISLQRDSALEAQARAEKSAEEARLARDGEASQRKVADAKAQEADLARAGEASQRKIAEAKAQEALAKERIAIAAQIAAVEAQESEKRRREQTTALLESIVFQMTAAWTADGESPDYRHLAQLSSSAAARPEFRVDLKALNQVLEMNRFQPRPLNDQIIFALRGAAIVDVDAEESLWVDLRDVRPDHRSLSCVFITADTRTGKIAAFPGTTVPSDPYLRTQFADQLEEARRAHLLPTGMYEFRVGTSHQFSRGGRPGVLTIRQQVAVRRTNTDLIFDVRDPWYYGPVGSSIEATNQSRMVPIQRVLKSLLRDGQNLSVANVEGDVAFSSAGVLQIDGRLLRVEERMYSGPFAQFRRALGLTDVFEMDHNQVFKSTDDGTTADFVLVTGSDVALASEFDHAGSDQGLRSHMRLRWGSSGQDVRALQKLLGVEETGVFGVETSRALADLQFKVQGWSDGIFSVENSANLGLIWN